MWKKILLTIIVGSLLSNCTPYDFTRREVQQGNLLTEHKIKRLKTGMSKEDVSILLGNSLLSPAFNNNRWDYAYTWRKGTDPLTVKYVSLFFNQGRLVRIEHYALPKQQNKRS